MTTEVQHNWDLPTETAVYNSSHCQTFLHEKNLFELIMLENPVLSNAGTPQIIDDFTTPLMPKRETSVNLSLQKIQQKTMIMMVSLSPA